MKKKVCKKTKKTFIFKSNLSHKKFNIKKLHTRKTRKNFAEVDYKIKSFVNCAG